MSEENEDQRVFWEGFAVKWVDQQSELDALMAPVLDGVFERAALAPGQRVLDIGCGTGTSSLRAVDAVGATGSVLGVDISEPMLQRARTLAKDSSNLSFETADAADFAFPDNGFDAVISRFGVMFFADPVKAFVNIRRAMGPGARLTMAAWSMLDRNPWFSVPMYAAKERLGAPPAVDPDAPGPLAFRDIERVTGILAAAGFAAIEGEYRDLMLTPTGDLPQVAMQASSIGPVTRTMDHFEGTEEDLKAIARKVETGFSDFETSLGLRIPAGINFFTATAP